MEHPSADASAAVPRLDRQHRPGELRLELSGAWTFSSLHRMEALLRDLPAAASGTVVFQCRAVTAFDLTGAWLLHRAARRLEDDGARTEVRDCAESQFRFMDLVRRWPGGSPPEPFPGQRLDTERLLQWLERIGQTVVDAVSDSGLALSQAARGLLHPNPLAFRETVRQVQETGLRAVPIVSLIAFLMGVVLTYQGARQLGYLGAEIFTVDLVAIAMLREMAGLITAIIVAGRSGSAFAATLGTMQLNDEIDAYRVVGVDPLNALVAPRIVGLLIALPLLTVLADIVGMGGAWLLSVATLEISTTQFFGRLQEAVELSDFLTGMVKVPCFALIIAAVGTLRGLEIERSAEELGRQTTRAVVQSISAVLLMDAVFSVAFAELGI